MTRKTMLMKAARNAAIILLIATTLFAICLMFADRAMAATNEEAIRTRRQEWLHWMAEEARKNGEPEDGPIIKTLQQEWWQEQEDLSILAKVIAKEAGGCPWNHKVTVAAVVLNRVKCPYFKGNTVKEIVAAPAQYLESYTYGFEDISKECWLAAKAAMDGEHNVPPDVVWQAEFLQGKSVWWKSEVDTGWYHSITYFCRGIPGVDEPWW